MLLKMSNVNDLCMVLNGTIAADRPLGAGAGAGCGCEVMSVLLSPSAACTDSSRFETGDSDFLLESTLTFVTGS